MAEESVLALVEEIYRPFDANEIGRLRTYIRDAEVLVESAFFTDPGRGLRLATGTTPERVKLTDIDDEAIRAVVPRSGRSTSLTSRRASTLRSTCSRTTSSRARTARTRSGSVGGSCLGRGNC
jgi:hypothetical protein